MKAILNIKLLSDCLPGSGIGNSAYIDSDCVFDEYGLPLIPGRRLKGCLRETANQLLEMGYSEYTQHDIEMLFGSVEHSGLIVLGNAEIENARQLQSGIDYYRRKCGKESQFLLNVQSVQECFTNTRTQTSVSEEGIIKPHSLRTFRTLRRGLNFRGEIAFPDQYRNFIKMCAKALRYIGTNRSRGLGHVRIQLEEMDDAIPTIQNSLEIKDGLELILELKTPIIVEGQSIPGAAIRGALAACYMANYPAPPSGDYADDEIFRQLFLDGLQFEAAMPTDGKGRLYRTFPASVVRYKTPVKGEPEYVNLAVAEPGPYQTKTISEGAVCFECDKAYVVHALRIKQMHHVQQGQLFGYSALAQNQRFLARISGPKTQLEALSRFIDANRKLQIGRSRNAQYGDVRIVQIGSYTLENKEISGNRFILKLETPVILYDECGTAVADCRALMQMIAHETGTDLQMERCFASVCNVSGYNPQWKLSKQAIQALDTATTIVCFSNTPIALPRTLWIGEKNNEGYGLVSICAAEELLPCFDASDPDEDDGEVPCSVAWQGFINMLERKALRSILEKWAFERAERDVASSSTLQKLFTFTYNCTDLKTLTHNVDQIKDPEKKNRCFTVLFDGKQDIATIEVWFVNEVIHCLSQERIYPVPRIMPEQIEMDWELLRFYLLERLKNRIILLSGDRRKGGKKA